MILINSRAFLAATALAIMVVRAALAGEDWPQFRGPGGQGQSDSVGLPVRWSETENIRFKTEIPGEGWSSPVILGKQVWLTTATEGGKSLRAVCVDRDLGTILRDVEVFHQDELDPKNSFNSYASPTPVLEPGRAYVSFGNYGNACLDTQSGTILWKTRELRLEHKEGPGSSPILVGSLLLLDCDGMDVQYLAALDKRTGHVAWKTTRSVDFSHTPPDRRKAYCTPLIASVEGKVQAIDVGARRVYGYDPAGGAELWHLELPGYSNVPRPVFADGLAYISTGYDVAELWAIRPPVAGEQPRVEWKFKRGSPLKPSIVFADGAIYFVSDNGIGRCLDAKTGEEIWHTRLLGNCTASGVYAGGLIYFFDEHGKSVVLRPGKTPDVVAENELKGKILASPAISGRALFVRTHTHLYRIENAENAR